MKPGNNLQKTKKTNTLDVLLSGSIYWQECCVLLSSIDTENIWNTGHHFSNSEN